MTSTSDATLTLADGPEADPAEARSPYLFLVLDSRRPLERPARFSLAGVDVVELGRGARVAERRDDGDRRRLVVRVPDPTMSSSHARLERVMDRWVLQDDNSKNGTRVNGAPQLRALLSDGDLVELGRTFFLYREYDREPDRAAGDLDEPPPGDGVLGLDTLVPSLDRELRRLREVARSNVSVVVHGESGTGKELIARAVHALSGRSGPFVAINCGALPENLVEAELFGHKKGAFSGATETRPGLIRSADGGTLFLDEIGDLSVPAQVALLRVLQEREVVSIGDTRAVPVDFRLVAATHRDLPKLVEEDRFRGDLFARISGFTLRLPPLRERREDLGLLVGALLRASAPERAARIELSAAAARALFGYAWPLNIRELEKALGVAAVFAGDGTLELAHLPETLQSTPPPAPSSSVPGSMDAAAKDAARPLTDEEARHRVELVALLERHSGNVAAVARELGKKRMQIHRWIKRYRIDPDSYRR